MPRVKGTAVVRKHAEPENSVESEEQVDFDGDNNSEMEEEVEYEEMEEEVEEVEYEEVEEEEEEEEEEEVEQEEEGEDEDANIVDAQAVCNSDNEIETILDEDERKKHAELLALPPHGSELHFGGIPVDASEEDLKTFCESIGEVTEVKVVKDKRPGETRAYAFVTFKTKDLASKAIKDLNDSLFKGKKIKCSISQTKNRLFIGHIPRSWEEEELRKVVTKVGPGVSVIELVKDPQNSCRNRGFAFIEYYNHACADYSRKKMSKQEFKFDTNAPTVSWADPRNADSSASASAQVKVVYVKNLPKDITQDQLKELFEHHGKITKVVLPPGKSGEEKNRFGFVYFEQKSSALKALKNTEKYEIEGQVLECSLAKSQPHGNGKADSGPSFRKPTLLPSYPPRMGYGLTGDAYGGVGGRYGAAGIAQPLMYGGMPTPSGMAMMPMRLPDGRIGYVMQQPRSHPLAPPPQQRSSRSSGSRSSSGSRYSQRDIGDRERRYRPY